jgi:hypothetical protein
MSDGDVARRARVSVDAVRAERRRRGIPAFAPQRPPIEWTDSMDAMLGSATDREVAAELELPARSVTYRRNLLGIAPYQRRRTPASPFWTAARVARLGKLSDEALARRWAISVSAVHARRRILGIPAFGTVPVPVRWTSSMRARLGRASDARVAAELGLTTKAVRRERSRLGVPPGRPAPRKVVRTPALRRVLVRSNREAMAELGIGHDTLTLLRREYGLPVRRPPTWTRSLLRRLGREPDERIAAELGIAPTTVARKRRQLGIRKRRAKARGPVARPVSGERRQERGLSGRGRRRGAGRRRRR